jgi:ArsR family transcriptional regulator, arsenate/arsenite/antimonite-responsive transcriptional repressor
MILSLPVLSVSDAPTRGEPSSNREPSDQLHGGAGTDSATLDTADALFKGFADPTRLRILNLLAAGELCVCDIVEILGVAQPTVSRHLAYLRRSGLVSATRDWKFAHYRLAPARDAVHQTLIGCVAACFRGIETLDRERAAAVARVTERRQAPCN